MRSASGLILPTALLPHPRNSQEFTERLLSAARRTAPGVPLEGITTAMSQSGLAALERASLYELAFCGGRLAVTFELKSDAAAETQEVSVSLDVRRYGFSEYIHGSCTDEAETQPCDASSSVVATAIFHPNGDVDVDFVEF